MYAHFVKRLLDLLLSLTALLILLPFMLIFTLLGAIIMRGNPFFVQPRPGKNEKIFNLIKFRTMTCRRDANGELLPDEQRLTRYGRFLRSTSIDELPELLNILIGDMSIIGPRPLLVKYLPLYNAFQHRRHEVRPGLTGLAQANGRNLVGWERKFEYDVRYVDNITFIGDCKIILKTIDAVFRRSGISSENSQTAEEFKGSPNSAVAVDPQNR